MIFALLNRHWAASGQQSSLRAWLLAIGRSLRVLLDYRAHRALCRLDVYRNYVAPLPNDDPFHHISHRHYLIKGLSVRQRVRCVLTHHRFEDGNFDRAYKHAVYRAGGLALWQARANGSYFAIVLEMASRKNAEGDLTVSFQADGKCLHRLSFSWIEGAMAGLPCPIVPFLARNQGRWTDSAAAFAAFELAFPNNSPSFFCFAAMQGIAGALGLSTLVGVKSACQVSFDPAAGKHFTNAYDGFWKILGGVALPGNGYLIALPFYLKPLADMPAKHRKRAATRRAHWKAVADAAGAVIARHLLHARALSADQDAHRPPSEA